MKFIYKELRKNQNLKLIYQEDEYSFDTERLEVAGFTSILINDLQLEIDDKGEIGYVWGYCPLIEYEKTTIAPKEYKAKSLIVVLDKPLIPGVSHRLNDEKRWPIYINLKEGWVCIGDPKIENKELIEFAPNCIAAMSGEELLAVWLHPEGLPKF